MTTRPATGGSVPAPPASSPAVRASMQGNRSLNTKPEQALRSLLHRQGLRFRKHLRPVPKLACKPDVVFVRERVAVFVDGCFWHGCPEHGRRPKTNPGYWSEKIERNRARDARNDAALHTEGWHVSAVGPMSRLKTSLPGSAGRSTHDGRLLGDRRRMAAGCLDPSCGCPATTAWDPPSEHGLPSKPMARDWESWLQTASGPASNTEEQDRDRTVRRIEKALGSSSWIDVPYRVWAKGSYKNNTNVRLDADVDIAVECTESAYLGRGPDASGKSWDELGVTLASTDKAHEQFRRQVLSTLYKAFGTADVDAGDKAITVAGGSSSLDADVVPCHTLHRYDARHHYHEGTRIFPTDGPAVDNWDQQNYDNGVAKNARTGRRYKRIVRCLKRLENEMLEQRTIEAAVPGYLIECLVWNAPDDRFDHNVLLEDLRAVLAFLWGGTRAEAACKEWGEINELKYLFRSGQKWARSQAHDFVDKAWDTVGVR